MGTDAGDGRLKLGYACSWWTPREATWSYIAVGLRRGLDQSADVVDIETQRPVPVRAVIAGAGVIARSAWQYSVVHNRLVDRAARRRSRRAALDAVVGVGGIDTPLAVPMFSYQDMSKALALSCHDAGTPHVNIYNIRRRRFEALAAQGTARLRNLPGVFAMSQWLANDLIDRGVHAERIRVVHAGLNGVPAVHRDPTTPAEGRLLFVGVEFERKGGPEVVAATRLLRERGVDVRLTVVGPDRWPLDGPPPDYVDYRGRIPPAAVGELLATHDVFVMPSHFEAYGIAFVEALAGGLPCVAHNAFAMPELVCHGETGLLVDKVEPEAVAEAVASILDTPAYFQNVAKARSSILERHSWRAVGARMVEFIQRTIA